jgi:pyruvate dehydrogenase E1 component alpha subunit
LGPVATTRANTAHAPSKTGRASASAEKKKTATRKPDERIDFYRQMLLIRRFEEKAAEMYQRARIGGYCHLNLGEEATCVGMVAGMRPTDYMFTNYREHGYAIARGMDPKRVMAELFGREDGVSKGRGGSMHLFSTEHRLMGGYGIVGGQLPLATGAALAIVRQGKDEAVIAQMGDATTNIGAFHESLNLAGLWKLPVVFVIINNGFGMGTSVDHGSAEPDLWKKASAYRMPGERVNGLNPVEVRDAVKVAMDRARKDRQPALLDIVSNRLKGHSVVDPDRYRSPEFVAELRKADPVPALAALLKKEGLATDKDLQQWADEVEEQVQDCVDFAEKSPEPDPSALFDMSYATPVENQPSEFPGQQAW